MDRFDDVIAMHGSSFDIGTWYQSAVTGLWYRNRLAAGEICAIRRDGITEYREPDDDREEIEKMDGKLPHDPSA